MRRYVLPFAAALAALHVAPALAEESFDAAVRDTLGGDPAQYRRVIAAFQTAVRSGDAAAVARLVSYPITVTVDGARRQIDDAAAFVAAYPSIVTPTIADLVDSEEIGEMLVNDQGVMLGSGEVWISGVCAAADTACARPEVKVITIQPTDMPPPTPAGDENPAMPGASRSFGDWVIGCDNYRGCVAVGMMGAEEAGSYVVVRRGATAESLPSVVFSALTSEVPENATLRVEIGGGRNGAVRMDLPVEVRGGFLTAATPTADVAPVIAAIETGHTMTLTPLSGGAPGEAATVSLKGSAAALLYMDDQQRRVGTVTALMNPGPAAGGTISAVDTAPVWTPRSISALPDPLPPLPEGVTAPADPSCGADFAPMAFTLSPTETLWGVCAQAGAYNIDYKFWLVGPDGARPADFTIPGRKAADAGEDTVDPSILTSPALSPDTLSLNSLQLGRGLGDCGTRADWGWDGAALRLVQLREMPDCRGVDQEDWPTLFLAAPL